MLKLRTDDVREHWTALAPGLTPLFDEIDRVEDWPVDEVPLIAERIVQLGKQLADPQAAAALEQADRVRLLFILVYMRTSKALRLVQWLDEAYEGLGTRLVASLLAHDGAAVYAGVAHDTLAKALVARLRMVNNTPFFCSVFHPRRLANIERAIKTHQEESAHA